MAFQFILPTKNDSLPYGGRHNHRTGKNMKMHNNSDIFCNMLLISDMSSVIEFLNREYSAKLIYFSKTHKSPTLIFPASR